MKNSIAGIVSIFFLLTAFSEGETTSDETYRELDLLAKVLELVKDTYVEEVDERQLLEAAIRGMLNDLDPHSGYMDASIFRENQIQTRGEYGGLGIEVLGENGALKVIAPMDDTPASRAGIQTGDFITHIEGESLSHMDQNEAVENLRGIVGTEVTITIVRPSENKTFDVKLTREVISISAVRHRIERGEIGYLRLNTFNNEKLTQDLKKAIRDIKREAGDNLKGYILDLRNNPGGLLDQAIEVSDVFLERGEVVSIRGRQRSENARWNATRGDDTGGLPLIVLINAGSASASEIVAGALQDHKRATILGIESFGKGLVQTVYPLADDRAVRITTARYYTPSGRSIQTLGIKPDIIVEQPIFDSEGNPVNFQRERDLSGHIPNENGDTASNEETPVAQALIRPAPVVDEDGNFEDYQLNYALDLLTGVIEMGQRQALLEAAE